MRASSTQSAILVTVVLAACSTAGSREFGQADTDAINKLIGEFITVYNAKDAVKVAALFSPGGVVMPPNASTVRGSENVRVYYVNRFQQGASDLALQPSAIAGHGPLAFASGDYRLVMAPPGGESRRDRGKFIFIVRDIGGKWLLDHLMFSSDFAATPPG